MTPTVDALIDAVADRVTATIAPLYALIDEWRDATRAELERQIASSAGPTAAELDPFTAGLATPSLVDQESLVAGAGFVAAPGFLGDAPWHLAWWLAGPGGALRRLDSIDDPESEQFRDYRTLEWWRVPAATGRRHFTGPYVDYMCTDDYTFTITTPVEIGGGLVGVVGADLYVVHLERVLVRALRDSGLSGTLVNASGRIVTSTDAHRATGDLLRLDGLAEVLARVRAVVEGDRSGDQASRAASSVASDVEIAAALTRAELPGGGVARPCGATSLVLVTGA